MAKIKTHGTRKIGRTKAGKRKIIARKKAKEAKEPQNKTQQKT
jgi:hypothetical protein